MKGEGERGNKKKYKNVSLRLCIIIHEYIDAQSRLLHTLSLTLSLPLIHTHTHTHTHTTPHHTTPHTTHTFIQSKSGRYELIRILEVEERFFKADLKLSIVAAFLMCSGSEFQTEGPK